MGTWGAAPWDNDDAADFFNRELRDTGLIADVVATLEDDDAGAEAHRGAAAVMVVLGRNYVWPDPDGIEYHLELAAAKLQAMRDRGDTAYSAVQLEEEIDILKGRAAYGGGYDARNPSSWDNAGTAAYIRALLERTGLVFAARQAISSPWGDEEFRAAAALVVLFGREGAWPSELDTDLRSTRDGLAGMLAHDRERGASHWLRAEARDAWFSQIFHEIELLDARLARTPEADALMPSAWETDTEEAVRERGVREDS